MSKTSQLSVESTLPAKLNGFKEQAAQVKAAHRAARQQILHDERLSDVAKAADLANLDAQTRQQLDSIKAEQDSYVNGLRSQLEKEFRGNQPADASSVLLRRDAADRARKIADKDEAMQVLNDAIANGDAEMAHAIGTRALNHVWGDVADAWQTAYPDTADSAAALAYVEANTSGAAWNMANGITFSDPQV
jgi:hypothetical protein